MVLRRKTFCQAGKTGKDSVGLRAWARSGKWTEPKKAERRSRRSQAHSGQQGMLEYG